MQKTGLAMNICIVAVGASSIIEIDKIRRSWQIGPWADFMTVSTYYVGSDTLSDAEWPRIFRSIAASDFVLLDTMGVPAAFDDARLEGENLLVTLPPKSVVVLRLAP